MLAFGPITPVLRSFDEVRAREFYLGFLGFELVFEHRFGENSPLYMGVARGDAELHISEHYGDATPGAQIRVRVDDVVAYASELSAKNYRNAKPGTDCPPTEWGTREVTISDPFGNKLTFWQPTDEGGAT